MFQSTTLQGQPGLAQELFLKLLVSVHSNKSFVTLLQSLSKQNVHIQAIYNFTADKNLYTDKARM